MKKRLLQGLITCIVMSSLIVTPVMATPKDDVKSLEKQKKQAEAQAADIHGQLVDLLVEYDALKKDISTQEKRIAEAEKDLKKAKAKEKKQYEDMKLRIKYMYEEGDSSFVETLITSKSFSDLVSKTEYVQKVHKYDRDMLDKYVKTKKKVVKLKDNLEEGQAEMQFMAEEMGRQKSNMESTLTEMESQIDDFDTQLKEAKKEAEEQLQQMIEASQDKEEKPKPGNGGNKPSKPDNGNDNKPSKPDNGNDDKPSKPDNGNDDKPSRPDNGDDSKPDKPDNGNDSKPDNEEPSKPSNASLGQRIANKGCEYIGNKYVYGGNSLTNGIDCSGFVQQIHKKFGISTPRSSSAQRSGGKAVAYADKLPGDVICYSGHVAIYIGNNTVVHASNSAPYPKGGIKTTSPANYRTVLAVRRYW